MTRRVDFADPERYELAAALAAPLGASADPRGQSVTAESHLAALLGRVARGEAAALPARRPSHDEWLVMGASRRDLDAALAAVARFIVPTYAEYDGAYPALRLFDPDADPISRLGCSVYPAGYYLLRSPSSHYATILERLGRWAELETARPLMGTTHPPSYRELYDAFSAALSAGMWDAAEEALAEIGRRGLATAENLVFLEVQLLAQQRRWSDLWRRDDFKDIARLRSPRAVRAALLAAFHQSELLPLEQAGRWADALDAFRRLRGALGGLVEGPPPTAYGPALRVYAYREAAAGDRAATERLAQLTHDETRLAIEALVGQLPQSATTTPPATPEQPRLTAGQMLRRAMAEGDFAGALRTAESLEDPAERTRGMLEAAFMSYEPAHTEAALLEFWALPQPEQEALLQDRRLTRMVQMIGGTNAPPAPIIPIVLVETLFTDWLDWLATAAVDADDRRLARSLPLVMTTDDHNWTAERVAQLAERLTDLAAGGVALSRPHLRDAVRWLRNHFLQDLEFPRDEIAFEDVYEALYTATLEQREVNEATTLALLRLAEARLRRAPAAWVTVADHLRAWLVDPIPALGGAALEALDLLAAYGAQGPALGPWFRAWAESALAAPRVLSRATLEGWLSFGEWAQPGDDLLQRLSARIASIDEAAQDPIALLPHGYIIGIFTLRPESAARVGELLQRRNPGVQVRLCADTVLTAQARTLAQSADMCVIVTTCITHALTYGIGPYLSDPVYPQSSGSTSILRVIEERLRFGQKNILQ